MPCTLDDLTWPRRTARLELRRPTPEDADALWELKGDPELSRWTTRLHRDRGEFDATWADHTASDLVARWDGRLAAVLVVAQEDAWSQTEVAEQARGQQVVLGWRVATWAQGQRVATELAREGLAIAFDMGVHRVEAHCFLENTASRRVMERAGMRQETHAVKESLHRDGTWHDHLTYAMLAGEFAAAG